MTRPKSHSWWTAELVGSWKNPLPIFLYGSVPDPGPPRGAQAGPGRALFCTHVVLIKQALPRRVLQWALCSGHPIGHGAAGGQESSLLPDRCLGHSPTQAQSQGPASPCSVREGMYRGLEKKRAQDVRLIPHSEGKEQQFVQEGRGDDWRNRTCKTGRWLNSFRLTLEQALITETSWNIQNSKPATSPQRPKWTGQAEPAAAGSKTRYKNHGATEGARRGLWALGEQAVGLFLRGRRSSFED